MKVQSKLLVVLGVISLLAGCSKAKPDITPGPVDVEPEQVVVHDTAASQADDDSQPITRETEPPIIEEEQEIVLPEMLLKEFLARYFPGGDYTLMDKPLDVNYRKIYFAAHYIKGPPDRKMFDTAVGFGFEDGVFRRYLLIRDFQFINEDGSVFLDFSEKYAGIYAFDFLYSHRELPYTPGLVISTYFDEGARPADDFGLYWNEENGMFERLIQSSPLWRPGL